MNDDLNLGDNPMNSGNAPKYQKSLDSLHRGGENQSAENSESSSKRVDRHQLLYQRSIPLIIPALQIYDADASKRYFALDSYVNK